MTTRLDLEFPVSTKGLLKVDHAYHLLAALSKLNPIVHRDPTIGIHPIPGRYMGSG